MNIHKHTCAHTHTHAHTNTYTEKERNVILKDYLVDIDIKTPFTFFIAFFLFSFVVGSHHIHHDNLE